MVTKAVKIVAFVVYVVVQIAFIPMALIGVVLTGYRQIVVSKKLGVSQTAIEIINGRWTMHIFGIREDFASDRLLSVLPNSSKLGLWMVLFPLWLQTRISGQLSFYPRVPEAGDENIADMVPARTLHFDQIIRRTLSDVDQFVLMGAGYDTRAYGFFTDADVSIFEVDQPEVQRHKKEMLATTAINSDDVTFVSIDFKHDDLFKKLTEAGFDTSKKALFLWEGVTLYLSTAEVQQTMQSVKQHAASGSVLLVDIYAERMIELLGKSNTGGKILELTDEGLQFGLDFQNNWQTQLTEFVEAQSLSVGETHFLGSNNEQGPYAVVAELIC